MVIVGIEAYNRSTDLWGDDANEWKPERWLKPLPKALADDHSPGVYSHMYVVILPLSHILCSSALHHAG
jgi:cytochrome P450